MANFSFTPRGDLVITLERGDKKFIKKRLTESNYEYVFLDLIERQLCNGWENIRHIALWGNHINLTQEHETNDHGETISLGKTYTYEGYAVRSEIDELLANGKVILTMFE